jgi:hypothetical protein
VGDRSLFLPLAVRLLFLLLPALFYIPAFRAQTNTDYPRPKTDDPILVNLKLDHSGDEPGPKKGSNVPFFKLYGLKSDSLDIQTELSKGKPVFVFSGSYTCPHYASQISFIDSVYKAYRNEISFFLIYTIEAHPESPDVCPYSGKVWLNQSNLKEGLSYRQPKTYKERAWLAGQMVKNTGLELPVYLDAPDNKWLRTFGQLPNMAYLISKDGSIISKYLDYGITKKVILKDIRSLLVP